MLTVSLLDKLKELCREHENLNVVVRCVTAHEFGPDDDLKIDRVFYDADDDVFVIDVVA